MIKNNSKKSFKFHLFPYCRLNSASFPIALPQLEVLCSIYSFEKSVEIVHSLYKNDVIYKPKLTYYD